MDRVFASLRSWASTAKNKKARDKKSKDLEKESSFQNLPVEILEEIFRHLPNEDILQCRRVCSFLRLKVDQLHTSNLHILFNDGIYRRRPFHPLSFDIYKLDVQKLVLWKIPTSFFRQNFFNLSELDLSDCISTKNCQRLLENTPHLQILRMNSIAMGGAKHLQPGLSKSKDTEISRMSNFNEDSLTVRPLPLPISEIHLTLDYVPGFQKGFSCQLLIQNLLGIHNWNTPALHTLSFTVEPSSLREQFYFSLDTFLASIPFVSYKSLADFSINAPKLQPSNSTVSPPSPDLLKIQLQNLVLRLPNSSTSSLSPAFTKFLYAQRNLKNLLLVMNMKDSSTQELESHLKTQNRCLQQDTFPNQTM